MSKEEEKMIREILGSANKTVVEDVVATVAKVKKPVKNKPGSKDATRQGILIKDDTGMMDVLVWGGNYTDDIIGKTITIKSGMVSEFQGKKRLTVFDKNIDIDKSTKVSMPSTSTKVQASIKEKGKAYIANDESKRIDGLSRLLVQCFDAVYKQLKEAGYSDVPVDEVGKLATTVFLSLLEKRRF